VRVPPDPGTVLADYGGHGALDVLDGVFGLGELVVRLAERTPALALSVQVRGEELDLVLALAVLARILARDVRHGSSYDSSGRMM
jgi:hypothetical protein